MNSNLAFKRALDAVERELVNLQLDLATRNLENALLELRYIPDQPRVPAGNPDAGNGRTWADRPARLAFLPARCAWPRTWADKYFQDI